MWKLAAVENCIKLQIANAHFHHHAKSFERTKHYNEDIFAWRGMDFSPPCLLAIIVQLRNCKKTSIEVFFQCRFFFILQYHSINFIRLSVTLMTEKGLTTHKRCKNPTKLSFLSMCWEAWKCTLAHVIVYTTSIFRCKHQHFTPMVLKSVVDVHYLPIGCW